MKNTFFPKFFSKFPEFIPSKLEKQQRSHILKDTLASLGIIRAQLRTQLCRVTPASQTANERYFVAWPSYLLLFSSYLLLSFFFLFTSSYFFLFTSSYYYLFLPVYFFLFLPVYFFLPPAAAVCASDCSLLRRHRKYSATMEHSTQTDTDTLCTVAAAEQATARQNSTSGICAWNCSWKTTLSMLLTHINMKTNIQEAANPTRRVRALFSDSVGRNTWNIPKMTEQHSRATALQFPPFRPIWLEFSSFLL